MKAPCSLRARLLLRDGKEYTLRKLPSYYPYIITCSICKHDNYYVPEVKDYVCENCGNSLGSLKLVNKFLTTAFKTFVISTILIISLEYFILSIIGDVVVRGIGAWFIIVLIGLMVASAITKIFFAIPDHPEEGWGKEYKWK